MTGRRIILVVAWWTWCALCPTLLRAGDGPPMTDIQGQPLKPFDDPRVKALVLVFILPDCPIGNAYVPELHRLHAALGDRGAKIVFVHADPATTAARAREHAREFMIQVPVVLDPRHEWVSKAGATVAPEAAIFSPAGELLYSGRIDNRYAGLGKRRMVVTEHSLRSALEAVLAGRPVKEPKTEVVGCLIPELANGK